MTPQEQGPMRMSGNGSASHRFGGGRRRGCKGLVTGQARPLKTEESYDTFGLQVQGNNVRLFW
jgi:hypothetical protein